jgi:hypothetical protein
MHQTTLKEIQMIKRFLAVLVTAGVLGGAPALRAQASLMVSGGLNAPVGQLGDGSNTGYIVSAGLNLGAPIAPVGARLEGSYSSLGFKDGSGDVRLIYGTANAIFNLGTTADAPYLIAGLGAYNRSFGSNTFGYGNGSTVVGINGGAGLRFPLSGLSTFFEARYHIMLGNDADGTNYQFIPITFGISF